jgi:RsiW-degrading membrane proteinase PrsW (M82 family)
MMQGLLTNEVILLLIVSFLPPVVYTIWIRNTEHYKRQTWLSIIICFLWGATVSTVAAIILELLLRIPVSISIRNPDRIALITVVVLAPIVEELTKPLAISSKPVKKNITELEDGLIYGAVAGLGFSATENLLYGVTFLQEGLFVFLVLMIIRSIGGCLLHASATALTGYGYGKVILNRTSFIRITPYFILAVILHASYNFLVSFERLGLIVGLLLAIIIVVFTISRIRKKIIRLDREGR